MIVDEPEPAPTPEELAEVASALHHAGVPAEEARRRLAEIAKDDAALDADEATP